MSKIISKINKESSEFKENKDFYQKLLSEYKAIQSEIIKGGSDSSIEKHKKRGKLTARERIKRLIDFDSPFMEICQFAAYDMYDKKLNSAGLICGVGEVHGQKIMLIANDPTVKGGTYHPITVKKHLRAQEIALRHELPCVYLVESGGAFLPLQDEIFPDKEHFGRIFFNQANMSARNIPQISVVHGSCTAGGAYVPAMSDEVVIVKNQGTIFLAGPPLVKAALGEDISAEELGGGDVHTKESGVADYLAENDEHAILICRDIIANLKNKAPKSKFKKQKIKKPKYDANDIYGIIPKDEKKSFDIKEIIARLVDASEFHEFKAEYGETLVTGFGEIYGKKVGILANNGILFSQSALKGAHFIQLCEQRNIPLLFLQNITGFMVGKEAEWGGIAKNGAKLVTAVASCNVPKYTIICGGSYGAGNYGMCGRAFEPEFLFMWPNAKISVMGGKQAALVLKMVGAKNDDNIDEIIEKYNDQAKATYSSARLWDDGIILPHKTREILGYCLNVNRSEHDKHKFGLFRM